ncbi:MAG: flavin reductase [Bacteroidales bacterium]|nr:flavin reductase [Bacteroidales bacterium]
MRATLSAPCGRDMDKISAAGLTPVEPEVIGVPGLKEFPLTLECRVLYRQEQESDQFNDEITRQFYTIETGDHICYYGEIVASYVIED